MSFCRFYCSIFQVKDGDRHLTFCGFHPPPPITSKEQSLKIMFNFDSSSNDSLVDVGFNATYSHVDGNGNCFLV